MNSSDHVRKIVQEEGRTARNLVQYNVLLEDEEVPGMITTTGDTITVITIIRIGYSFIVGCFFFTYSMQAETLSVIYSFLKIDFRGPSVYGGLSTWACDQVFWMNL